MCSPAHRPHPEPFVSPTDVCGRLLADSRVSTVLSESPDRGETPLRRQSPSPPPPPSAWEGKAVRNHHGSDLLSVLTPPGADSLTRLYNMTGGGGGSKGTVEGGTGWGGVLEESRDPFTYNWRIRDPSAAVVVVDDQEDVSNVQIMCAWCQKVGIKRYSLSMGSELKSFCSEKCFAACRRAYFKRNKLGYVRSCAARDEDGHGENLPQHSFSKDTPRLVFKINSDVLVCILQPVGVVK
ncbi:hypothetical protein GN956_G25449 [Arapaima gigas]